MVRVRVLLLAAAGGAFQFNGVSQPEVAYKANAIRTTARGVRHVSFPDGQRIEVSYPYYILRGAAPVAVQVHSVEGTGFSMFQLSFVWAACCADDVMTAHDEIVSWCADTAHASHSVSGAVLKGGCEYPDCLSLISTGHCRHPGNSDAARRRGGRGAVRGPREPPLLRGALRIQPVCTGLHMQVTELPASAC